MKAFLLLCAFVVSLRAHADCKSLVVDDVTIAFKTGDGLEIKSANGSTTLLDLEGASHPECESMKIAKGSTKETPLVEVTYFAGEAGTKVLIDDKDFVLVDVKNKKLAVDPFTLEETQRRPLHQDHDVMATVEWKKKDGAMVLMKNQDGASDDTKESTQIWPAAVTAKATASPAASPSASPASDTEKRTNPEGTSDI